MRNLKYNSAVQGLNFTSPLDLVKLTALMEMSNGIPEIKVGLIDGPISIDHPDLARENIREIPGKLSGTCALASSAACMHGTFVAGILSAKRAYQAPAICPDCTLLIRPIFAESTQENDKMPSATPEDLAEAIIDCIDAGVHVINLSAAVTAPSTKGEVELKQALDHAAKRGVVIVAAAGNQGLIGSSVITSHPFVIPVVACDLRGRLISQSNIGISIGRRGLAAPGESITSLGANGSLITLEGTSAAAPFVAGTAALLWSLFPKATATEVKLALTQYNARRRTTVVPILMDAWAAYEVMKSNSGSLII